MFYIFRKIDWRDYSAIFAKSIQRSGGFSMTVRRLIKNVFGSCTMCLNPDYLFGIVQADCLYISYTKTETNIYNGTTCTKSNICPMSSWLKLYLNTNRWRILPILRIRKHFYSWCICFRMCFLLNFEIFIIFCLFVLLCFDEFCFLLLCFCLLRPIYLFFFGFKRIPSTSTMCSNGVCIIQRRLCYNTDVVLHMTWYNPEVSFVNRCHGYQENLREKTA